MAEGVRVHVALTLATDGVGDIESMHVGTVEYGSKEEMKSKVSKLLHEMADEWDAITLEDIVKHGEES